MDLSRRSLMTYTRTGVYAVATMALATACSKATTPKPTPTPTTASPTPTPTPTPTPPPLDELWAYDEEAVHAYLGCGCGYFLSGAGWVILCPSFPPAVQSEPLAY